ncbi:MAG TPA: glycosyltransferase [Terriglobia bacterium]|jgi:glycosyltransferase involved in cell wall biosynthesis
MPAATPILKFLTKFAVGGTERQFVYLAEGLDRLRFEIRVGCLSREGEFLKKIEALNIPVTEYPINSLYSPRMLRGQWRLARDLRRQHVQLVHAYGFYPNVFSIPAARFAGCVAVASVRDTGVFSSQVALKTLSQKTACRLADHIIANSSAVKGWLTGLGLNENHIDVIPNGIALDGPPRRSLAFPIRRELGISTEAPVIAVVSRLNPRKGIEYFLHAAVTVADRFPAARFLIVGGSADPAYKSSLEKLAGDLKLERKVKFTGERNDVRELLSEVTLAVLPSLSEGLSNSLLEAMAAGIPVVSTNVGGNPEVVQDDKTGFLVGAADPQALSDGIARIIESPDLGRQFGEAGYQRAAAHFSLRSTVQKTEDLYTALLEQRMWRHARLARAS